MKKEPPVSIIVVNWNGGEVFEDCLRSLSKLTYRNWELIVMDNGSTDGSQRLPQNFQLPVSNYQLIENGKNLGFAKANNQGYQISRGKYILLLNNDTRVAPHLLNVLVEEMEEERRLGVVQPKIYLMDDTKRLDNAGSFLTWTGFLEHWGYTQKDSAEYNQERFIFSAKGACMFIRRSVIDKVGLFDSDFGSYFEETDFCWRVWLVGYSVLYYPSTYIYHKVGFTSKRLRQTAVYYHSFKNRILSLIKNLDTANLFLILGLHMMIIVTLGLYYLLKLQFAKSWMLFGAISWNVAHLAQAFRKRAIVQKLRVRSDEEIFSIVMKKMSIREMFLHFGRVEANF